MRARELREIEIKREAGCDKEKGVKECGGKRRERERE